MMWTATTAPGPAAREVPPAEHQPVHVQVEVTWRCNWRCVHCYQDDHTVERLTTANLIRLCGELAEAGTLHLIVTGGEPLMRPDLFDVLEAARSAGLTITLYTNGHRVDPGLADRLADLIAVAELSVLAGDEQVHDRLSRVRGSYRRTWRAVDLLRERHVEIVVKTPILRPAYPSLRELEKETTLRGVTWVADPDISVSYAGASYPLDHRLDDDELASFYVEFPQFGPTSGVTLDAGRRSGLCLAGRHYAFIDATGNVYPCLNFKGASDSLEATGLSSAANMGNVLVNSFADIWRGNVLTTAMRSARRSDFSPCSGCSSADAACTPCMAMNYADTGHIFEPGPRTAIMHAAQTSGRRTLPLSPL